MSVEITLNGLPKISLNAWYSGTHWTKRKKIKDTYKLLIKSQYKGVFKKDKSYSVSCIFFFESRPLDASNCVAMFKMIEDVLFESDSYKVVKSVQMSSRKADKDYVKLLILES